LGAVARVWEGNGKGKEGVGTREGREEKGTRRKLMEPDYFLFLFRHEKYQFRDLNLNIQ
jgi:hypothetical protein